MRRKEYTTLDIYKSMIKAFNVWINAIKILLLMSVSQKNHIPSEGEGHFPHN